jgi:hypothetical protein
MCDKSVPLKPGVFCTRCSETVETVEKLPLGSLFSADSHSKLLILHSSIGAFEGPKEFFNSLSSF